jgi:hypothetical protein
MDASKWFGAENRQIRKIGEWLEMRIMHVEIPKAKELEIRVPAEFVELLGEEAVMVLDENMPMILVFPAGMNICVCKEHHHDDGLDDLSLEDMAAILAMQKSGCGEATEDLEGSQDASTEAREAFEYGRARLSEFQSREVMSESAG